MAPGQIFPQYFGFSCQSFHRLFCTRHHSSSGAGITGQILADVRSGLSLTLSLRNSNNYERAYLTSRGVLEVPEYESDNCYLQKATITPAYSNLPVKTSKNIRSVYIEY
jgi:hypothetical protein